MKQVFRPIIIFLLMLVTLVGCSDNLLKVTTDMEKEFQITVPVMDMNESLQLKVDSDNKIFGYGSEIPLIINNRSPYSLFFATDSHIRLLAVEDGKWTEVKNRLTYSGLLVISPQGTPLLDRATTWVQPEVGSELQSAKKKVLLRIVMIGEIMEDDVQTGEFVGAYVDVYIGP